MKIVLKLLLILLLAGFTRVPLFAQQDILAASCNASGNGGTVSWSVGLVAYSSWGGASGSIIEGVQQPYEIFNLDGLEEFDSNPGFIVFPNPTTGKVTLKFLDSNLKNRSSCIYDMEGILLRKVTADTEEVTIPMDDLKPATYFLVILEKDQPVKTYKIIKK
jgi:hypothetical protein